MINQTTVHISLPIYNVKEQKTARPENQFETIFAFQAMCRTGHFVSVRQGGLYMVGEPSVSSRFKQSF
ncbi:hypothetical protein [Kordiimonas lipolytica]|nr:hypothetical protein [Kordiimonas lipolytica]